MIEGAVDVPIKKYWSINGYAGTMSAGDAVEHMVHRQTADVLVRRERPSFLTRGQPVGPASAKELTQMTDATVVREPDSSLVTTLHITYALHAVGLAIGAFGAATVLGSFIFGWPSIIAVIINYVKRGDARGTWLESHFEWQIKTFWYAVCAASILIAISGVLLGSW